MTLRGVLAVPGDGVAAGDELAVALRRVGIVLGGAGKLRLLRRCGGIGGESWMRMAGRGEKGGEEKGGAGRGATARRARKGFRLGAGTREHERGIRVENGRDRSG